MKLSDIRIKEMDVCFSPERFRTPLKLSSGPIADCTYAIVRIEVENRRGDVAIGIGAVFLSDLWSFPTALLTHEEKTECMMDMMRLTEGLLRSVNGYLDPFQFAEIIEKELPKQLMKLRWDRQYELEIPLLLGLVCCSPFDAALHDGWGKAWGTSSYLMYNRECLNEDLGYYLGEDWKGEYPEFYVTAPRSQLEIQHVVGVTDLLTTVNGTSLGAQTTADEADGIPADGLPVTLYDWILRDGVSQLKLKLKGEDVGWNLQFILDVYRVGKEALGKIGSHATLQLSLDPNEASPSPEPIVELLCALRERDAEAYEAITYIEQPTPRDLAAYEFTLHSIARYKPVIIDESLTDITSLKQIEPLGWSGMALKTCKGQSHAIHSYCWARKRGLFVTVQDLTNPGYALVQSANLASHLALSTEAFEYNSRQYVPDSRPDEQAEFPELFQVRNGQINLDEIRHLGLY
jgi:L-alanine-DL-glutamate epimerase-like enolase superfamily enzyme